MGNLLTIGLIIGGLWAIIRWRAVIKRVTTGSWVDVLLAFATIILLIAALSIESASAAAFDQSELLVVLLGIGLFIPGVRLFLVSDRPFGTVGLLSLSAGVILAIAAFAIPLYARTAETTQGIALPGPGAAGAGMRPSGILPVNNQANNSSFDVIEAPEFVDSAPLTIPTLSSPQLLFMTPTPRPELAQQCSATVTSRLNLRDRPSVAAGSVIAVIAEQTTITLVAQDTTAEWWYRLDEEQEGWLFGEYLSLETSCDDLPQRHWDDSTR